MKDKQPSEQGPITGLTPELMEGYVKGTLSPQLRRQVREFLDENSFEAEAMEGLKSQPTNLVAALQDLEGRLASKLAAKDKNFKYFWPVAASLTFLVISSLVLYFFMPGTSNSTKIAVKQEIIDVKSHEQLDAVPELDPTSSLKADKTPAAVVERKDEKVIIEVADEEEIEEQFDVNLEVETTAPAINNLAGEIQPNKTDFTNETEALPIDNLIEEQASTKQEGVIVDDRSKAKKATAATAGSQIARAQNQPAKLPLAEAPEGIMKYLKQHTKYPETAKAKGVQGTVIITFIVNETGGLEGFEIVEKLGYDCDEEAVRVLREGPLWKPAKINGKPVISLGRVEVAFPPQR